MEPVILILGALRDEIAGVKKSMAVKKQKRLGKTDVWLGTWQGRQVVLARTGVGPERAEKALMSLIKQVSPSLVISIGYAGGAHRDVRGGDLIVAERALALNPGTSLLEAVEKEAETFSMDASWVDLAKQVKIPGDRGIHFGGLLTVAEAVCDPELKRKIGDRFPVLAIDMETAVFARMARERNIPLFSVRAITDTVDQKLLDVSNFMEDDGEVSKLKAGWYILTHPGSFKGANSIRVQAQKATRNLTVFLAAFLADLCLSEK